MPSSLLAIDIGNTRAKLGLFDRPTGAAGLPIPTRTLAVPSRDWDPAVLEGWLDDVPRDAPWWIGSVNRAAADRLTETFQSGVANKLAPRSIRLLAYHDLPIAIALEAPERTGIDLLAGAVAANRLRQPDRPAIIVQVGSAITLNLIDAQGTFRGGAILPGIQMSARALGTFTDLLPQVALDEITEPPTALGASTAAAIGSGLYWGAVGATRELVARLAESLPQPPEVFLTGGGAGAIAGALGPEVRYVEHLVLSGIALARDA